MHLLPDAMKRSRRTLAFEAAKRARVPEIHLLKMLEIKEKEEMEKYGAKRRYQQMKFTAQPVPESHYKPHAVLSVNR